MRSIWLFDGTPPVAAAAVAAVAAASPTGVCGALPPSPQDAAAPYEGDIMP